MDRLKIIVVGHEEGVDRFMNCLVGHSTTSNCVETIHIAGRDVELWRPSTDLGYCEAHGVVYVGHEKDMTDLDECHKNVTRVCNRLTSLFITTKRHKRRIGFKNGKRFLYNSVDTTDTEDCASALHRLIVRL